MGTMQLPVKLSHSILGACELIRIEGAIWVVRHDRQGVLYRIPPSQRGQFRLNKTGGGPTAVAATVKPRTPGVGQPTDESPPESP